MSNKSKCRTTTLLVILVISMGDSTMALIKNDYDYNYLTNLFRPFVVVILLSSIRSNVRTIFKDLYESLTILATTFIFVVYVAVLFYYLFRNTAEGNQYLSDGNESVY